MTAFGGATSDPTKIMGSRFGAYVVDGILSLVLVLGIFYVVEARGFRSIDQGSPAAAEALCDQLNGVRSFDGTTPGPSSFDDSFQQDRDICVPVGSSSYVLLDDEVAGAYRSFVLISIGFTVVNLVLLPAIAGGSLGKLLFGLRVVTDRGTRAGIGRNAIRWIVGIVDFSCCGLPGLLIALNSKGHRRLGDMAAGTFVVHRSAEGRLLHIPGLLHVRNRSEFGTFGPTPQPDEPQLGEGGGIDAPVWDPRRDAYVRYDQSSGVWFQWDEDAQSWVPAQT